jgi:hypothetical protein
LSGQGKSSTISEEQSCGSLNSCPDGPSGAPVTVADPAIGARAGGTGKTMMTREGGSVRRMREEAGPAAAASARARWRETEDKIRGEVAVEARHGATRRDEQEVTVEGWRAEGMHAYMITRRREEACWWRRRMRQP